MKIADYGEYLRVLSALLRGEEQSIRDYEAGGALDDLVRRPPLPPGTSPMDMRPERPRA